MPSLFSFVRSATSTYSFSSLPAQKPDNVAFKEEKSLFGAATSAERPSLESMGILQCLKERAFAEQPRFTVNECLSLLASYSAPNPKVAENRAPITPAMPNIGSIDHAANLRDGFDTALKGPQTPGAIVFRAMSRAFRSGASE